MVRSFVRVPLMKSEIRNERPINRRERRAAAARARNKGRPSPLDLPLVQITLAKNGAPDKILTLSPAGLRDYFTACSIEHAHRQPIDEAVFEKLARVLSIEFTEMFRHEIYTTIIGTTLMIVCRWYSPRKLLQLFKKLKRDWPRTVAESRGDTFAELVASTIQQDVEVTGKSTREMINWHTAAISDVISRGRPDEEARSIFFETVITIAKKYNVSLALPPRDDSRGMTRTPLYEFGSGMCHLVVDYGNAMLERKQLPLGRFGGFAKLSRSQLIYHLEAARKTILQEESMLYT
jgi:hypothetical protein